MKRAQSSNFRNYPSIQPTEESNVIHMARIETDGTVSLSTTTPIVTATGELREQYRLLYPTFIFNFNRPFMFMIHDTKINGILFAGIYRGQ